MYIYVYMYIYYDVDVQNIMLRIVGPSSNSIGKPSHIKESSQKKHVCNLVSYNARGLFNTNAIKKKKKIAIPLLCLNVEQKLLLAKPAPDPDEQNGTHRKTLEKLSSYFHHVF